MASVGSCCDLSESWFWWVVASACFVVLVDAESWSEGSIVACVVAVRYSSLSLVLCPWDAWFNVSGELCYKVLFVRLNV